MLKSGCKVMSGSTQASRASTCHEQRARATGIRQSSADLMWHCSGLAESTAPPEQGRSHNARSRRHDSGRTRACNLPHEASALELIRSHARRAAIAQLVERQTEDLLGTFSACQQNERREYI